MKIDKCREVTARYSKRLKDYEYGPLSHCKTMLPKMEKMLDEGKLEKFFRWLGFMQGVLWVEKLYTLEELKDHNRPDSKSG